MKVNRRGASVIRAICIALSVFALVGCGCTRQDGAQSGATDASSQEDAQSLASETMVISTDRGDLYYSDEWEGLVNVAQETVGDTLVATFTTDVEGQTIGLFKVFIDGTESDGFAAGSLTDAEGNKHSVFIQVDDHSNMEGLDASTQDRIYAMTDGVNTLIEHLGE